MPRVVADPAPSVQLSNFAAEGIELSVNFWISDPEAGQGNVKSEVNLAVLDVLRGAGVVFPSAQRTVWTVVQKDAAAQPTPTRRRRRQARRPPIRPGREGSEIASLRSARPFGTLAA